MQINGFHVNDEIKIYKFELIKLILVDELLIIKFHSVVPKSKVIRNKILFSLLL